MVIPAKLNKKEGMIPVLIDAILLNTKVKITEVNKGCIKNHKGPNMVCLYTVTISRFTKSHSKSLYLQISLKLRSISFPLGEISYNQSDSSVVFNTRIFKVVFIF